MSTRTKYSDKSSLNSIRKIRDYLIIFLILTILLAASFYQLAYRMLADKILVLAMRIVYENKDSYKVWNLTEDYRAIALFVSNSWQTVYLAEISHPIERFDYDSDGNLIAILNVTEVIGPGESMSYNVTYYLIYRERKLPTISEEESGNLSDIPEDLKRKYCEPTSIWQSNMHILREKAIEIMGNETRVLTIIKRFVDWIANNIDYGSSEIPRYPNETLLEGEGDCDDQANLLITFCRVAGIPAYLQVGCIYMPRYNQTLIYWNSHLLIRQIRIGWHGWAMVYVPPWGWLPVDLTYVEKGTLRENPLNSIMLSAVVKHYTFQYMNITVSDYIAESRAMKKFLEAHEFYVQEEDVMELSLKGLMPVKPILISTANSLYVERSFQKCISQMVKKNGKV